MKREKTRSDRERKEEGPPPATCERRPAESAQAYEGFLAYRDCGPKRTLQEAAERTGKSRAMLARWSRLHDWRERVFAWDREQAREAEVALREARQEGLKRQARDADRLQRLAMAKLGKLVRRDPVTGELELDPSVSVQDAVRIYRLGLDIARSLAPGAEVGPEEQAEDPELRRMTDRELRRLIALAKKRANTNHEEEENED